ncbi:MAG: LysM domain-containing protein [Myxococcota bacterium]
MRYVVRSGDSLDSIARKHGLPDWRGLYEAPENAPLRVRRKNPNQIRPGDVVRIPRTAPAYKDREVVIQKLKKLQADLKKSMQVELKLLDKHKRDVQRVEENVDLAATLATLAVDLTKLTRLGYKAMEATGKDLAKINAKAAPGALDFAGKHAGQLGGGLRITGQESLAWGLGKVLLISYSQMTSPSYWANRWQKFRTGKTPLEAIRDAERQVKTQHEAMIQKLQKRIDALRAGA